MPQLSGLCREVPVCWAFLLRTASDGAPEGLALLGATTVPLCDCSRGPPQDSLSSADPELGSKGQVLIRSRVSGQGEGRGWGTRCLPHIAGAES